MHYSRLLIELLLRYNILSANEQIEDYFSNKIDKNSNIFNAPSTRGALEVDLGKVILDESVKPVANVIKLSCCAIYTLS
jgi:hypothetical protein